MKPLITDEQRAQLLANGQVHAAGQPVECDLYFTAQRPLCEYLRLAQENGSITG